jgi:hypothetical protein
MFSTSPQFNAKTVVEAPLASHTSQKNVVKEDGQPIGQRSKTDLHNSWLNNREAFVKRMDKARSSMGAQTPSSLMQQSGRSAEFIAENISNANHWKKMGK